METKLSFKNAPRIVISKTAWDKMYTWTDLADGEVSGLGVVKEIYDKNGRLDYYYIPDVFLPQQECTGTTTEFEPEMVLQCCNAAQAAGYKFEDVRFWFHSHVNMGVFWSGTDESTAMKFAQDSNFVSVVINKRSEARGRLDLCYPYKLHYDDVIVQVEGTKDIVKDKNEDALVKITEAAKNLAKVRKLVFGETEKSALQLLMSKLNSDKNTIKKETKEKERKTKSERAELLARLKPEFDEKVKSKVFTYNQTDFNAEWYKNWAAERDSKLPPRENTLPEKPVKNKKPIVVIEMGMEKRLKDLISDIKEQRISIAQAVFEMQEIGIELLEAHSVPDKDGMVHFNKHPWTSIRRLVEEGLEEVGKVCEEYENWVDVGMGAKI